MTSYAIASPSLSQSSHKNKSVIFQAIFSKFYLIPSLSYENTYIIFSSEMSFYGSIEDQSGYSFSY